MQFHQDFVFICRRQWFSVLYSHFCTVRSMSDWLWPDSDIIFKAVFLSVTWWTIMSNAVGWHIFTCTLLSAWSPHIADAHLLHSPAKNFEDRVLHFNGLTLNPILNCANWNRILFSRWDLPEQTHCHYT